MHLGLLGTLLPLLWHYILSERLFKDGYGVDRQAFQLAAPPVFACFFLTTSLCYAALFLKAKLASSASQPCTAPPCSLPALLMLGLFDALSQLTLTQSFIRTAFPDVLVATIVGHALVQCINRQTRSNSCNQRFSLGDPLSLLGLAVYVLFARASPFGAYGSNSSFGWSTTVLITLHVLFSTASSAVKSSVLETPNNKDGQTPHVALAWTSLVSAAFTLAANILTMLFLSDASQWSLLRSSKVQLDVLFLASAFAISTCMSANISKDSSYAYSQFARFAVLLVNASVIGYFRLIGAAGWLGIAWMAAGVAATVAFETTANESRTGQAFEWFALTPASGSLDEKHETTFHGSIDDDISDEPTLSKSSSLLQSRLQGYIQMAMLALLPVVFAWCISFSSSFLGPVDPHSNFALLNSADEVVIEGTNWAVEAHKALQHQCPNEVYAQRYERTHLHTALATFPRSGNSWTRMLIERSSGWRTSTLYCDEKTAEVFYDDCYHEGKFLEKTHFPYLRDQWGWTRYEKAVRPVRNPLDASYSFWHFWQSINAGAKNHTSRVELDHLLGERPEERTELLNYASQWVEHDQYWNDAPIPQFVLRYEDLRRATMPYLMAMLAFFVPPEDLPSLGQVTCALELNKSLQPYDSAKRELFYSWDKIAPSVRTEMLERTQVPFCRLGYDRLFAETIGEQLPIDCDAVRAETGPPKPS